MVSCILLLYIAVADATAVPHLNEQKLEKYKEMRLLMRDSEFGVVVLY